MRVALVTTWGIACGIAEHSAYLKAAIEQADRSIAIDPIVDLHPQAILRLTVPPDVVILNYHAALHSQWTPQALFDVQVKGSKILVIYHDTGVPNSEQCRSVVHAADAAVVHEPFDDLTCQGPLHYWRMGIPDWPGYILLEDGPHSWSQGRPVLATVGFPFPWKNYDELARVTRAAGWALLLLAPTASAADVMRWEALNPWLHVERAFLPAAKAVQILAGCDATAFCYTCANTGQSGAVCLGIAARKPVFAFEPTICRQFRALYADPLANKFVRWCTSFDELQRRLSNLVPSRVDCGIVALAEQDSWRGLGVKYATLLRELVA